MAKFRLQSLAWITVAFLLSNPVWAVKHALLIGISDYSGSGLANLDHAMDDIDQVHEVLIRRFSLKESNITILRNKKATHRKIRQAFQALANKVQPSDFVYIHYSGHGSTFPDGNGDELYDQTWVSYGARESGNSLDQFDILDDELNEWLGPIVARSRLVVYVADTCHSASNTRNSAWAVRAAPPDDQHHPLASQAFTRYPLSQAIRIGAAQDDGQAIDGLFTEQWVTALERATPEWTWRQVFQRAKQGVRKQSFQQQPQLAGVQAGQTLGGEGFQGRSGVLVKAVLGNQVTLNAGKLTGITPGSVYDRFGAKKKQVRVRIQTTDPFHAIGILEQGHVEKGDFLVEVEHRFTTAPLSLYILPPLTVTDLALLQTLQQRINRMPGYVLTHDPAEAELMLALLRPDRRTGQLRFTTGPKGRASLPAEDSTAPLEVWVLTRDERLLHERMAIPLTKLQKGLDHLVENLHRYRRVREIERLVEESKINGRYAHRIELTIVPYQPSDIFQKGCQTWPKPKNVTYCPKPDVLTTQQFLDARWKLGDRMSFRLQNKSRARRYVYLLEIASDGQIWVIFPDPSLDQGQELLARKEYLDLAPWAMTKLTAPGLNQILLITTYQEIDPYLLTQEGYRRGGKMNPLERFLAEVAQGVKTRSGTNFPTGGWGMALFPFWVGGSVAESDF